MNTKFDKDQLKKETETERTTGQSNITYVKDDFFDNMSCEALDRVAAAENPKARGGWNYAEQRKLDMGASQSESRICARELARFFFSSAYCLSFLSLSLFLP